MYFLRLSISLELTRVYNILTCMRLFIMYSCNMHVKPFITSQKYGHLCDECADENSTIELFTIIRRFRGLEPNFWCKCGNRMGTGGKLVLVLTHTYTAGIQSYYWYCIAYFVYYIICTWDVSVVNPIILRVHVPCMRLVLLEF